jgi:leader peptidase (prepilin peptidase)/N-methyltransferase
VGGLGGLALIVASRAGMKSRIPYGPYMLTGALLAVLWGQQLGSFYLDLTVR